MAMRTMPGPVAGRPRPSGNFELFSWYFMRISGVVLGVLVLGHLAIMHVFAGVDVINSSFVAQRMANPLWRLWDWFMVLLALIHGVNGARWILDDYVHRPGSRVLVFSLLYTIAALFLLLGTLILLVYQPPVAGVTGGTFSALLR